MIKAENSFHNNFINNNFIIFGMGIGFWFVVTIIIFYLLFFAGLIDWNQDKAIIEIIELEAKKSVRPIIIFFLWGLMSVMAIISFLKLRKEPKYFTELAKNKFVQIPISMEVNEIAHSDVMYIKKSFFPLFGKSPRGVHPAHLLLLIALPIIQSIFLAMYWFKICYWIWNKFILKKDTKFMIFSYIIVFKSESEILNINLLKNSDYLILDEYLYKKFRKNIKDLDVNFTFVRVEEV